MYTYTTLELIMAGVGADSIVLMESIDWFSLSLLNNSSNVRLLLFISLFSKSNRELVRNCRHPNDPARGLR